MELLFGLIQKINKNDFDKKFFVGNASLYNWSLILHKISYNFINDFYKPIFSFIFVYSVLCFFLFGCDIFLIGIIF